jgi:hypothetical protein
VGRKQNHFPPSNRTGKAESLKHWYELRSH